MSVTPVRLLRRLGRRAAPEADGDEPDPVVEGLAAVVPEAEEPEEDPYPTACRAPHTSLHVDQFGDVRPCCQSSRVLGNISERSLTEIWNGEPLRQLREAVDRFDLSLGCEHCAWAGRGDHSLTYAARYDRDRLPEPGAGPARLELAPSNSCNLQCAMCDGDFSSAIRLHREGRPALPRRFGPDQLAEVEQLLAEVDEVHLFGGEPLLMPEALRLLESAARTGTRCIVTTNGTVWSERIEAILDRPGVELVVSVDGTSAEVYEAVRVGASWSTLQEHLDSFAALAARHGNRVDLAHCLMTVNWHEFPDHLAWAAERGLEVYVNDVLSPADLSLHHLTPPELAHVVSELRARQPEVEVLGEPWTITWAGALARLEQSWRDAETSGRHEHLGPLSAAEGVPAPLDPTDSSTLADVLRRRVGRRVRSTARVTLDPTLRVAAIEVAEATEPYPLGDPSKVIGRRSAEVATLMDEDVEPAARTVLEWSTTRAVSERRYELDGRAITERRTIELSTGGPDLRFESWWAPTREEHEAAITELIAGDLVTFDLDATGHLLAIGPADAAERLGLTAEIGMLCQDPSALLARTDPPEYDIAEVEPGVAAVDLRWADDRIIALAIVDPSGTHVLIGRPAPSP